MVFVADYRSDTITKPCADMRKAMMEAEVGDDVFGDDPTVKSNLYCPFIQLNILMLLFLCLICLLTCDWSLTCVQLVLVLLLDVY